MRMQKNPAKHVSPEQVQAARGINLLDFLKQSEPGNLTQTAPDEYRLKDHDSLVLTPSSGKFHWCSRGVGGVNAIDFLVKVRGFSFQDAVLTLVGENFVPTKMAKIPPPLEKTKATKAAIFELPKAKGDNSDIIEYLKSRGIEESVITNCIDKGLLYQNLKQSCVFVGFDSDKVAKFACERGTNSDFKRDVAGSDKAFNFCLPPKNDASQDLYVFESAIDCLSHATIVEIEGKNQDGHRLSLGGTSSLALINFLKNNPQITNIYMCLDRDKAGIDGAWRMKREIAANGDFAHINVHITPPIEGKDYNDALMSKRRNILKRKAVVDERGF